MTSHVMHTPLLQVRETEDRIDYEKLKEQERIAFYDEVILFEDELADNGAAVFSVKIVSALMVTPQGSSQNFAKGVGARGVMMNCGPYGHTARERVFWPALYTSSATIEGIGSIAMFTLPLNLDSIHFWFQSGLQSTSWRGLGLAAFTLEANPG